MMKLQSEI